MDYVKSDRLVHNYSTKFTFFLTIHKNDQYCDCSVCHNIDYRNALSFKFEPKKYLRTRILQFIFS